MGDWSYIDLEVTYVSSFEVQAIATVLTPEGSMYSFGCGYAGLVGFRCLATTDVPAILLKAIEQDLKLEVESHVGDSQTTVYGGN